MTYEKLTDTIDQKMLDFSLKMVALLSMLIWKPLAICTDPFFRKNFGERYLTGTSICISIVFWSIAEGLSKVSNYLEDPLVRVFQKLKYYEAAEWINAHNISNKVAFWISFAYGVFAITHFAWIQRRRAKPGRWYSMSRGESIFGTEDTLRDLMISVGAVGALGVFAPPIAFLFLCSRIASFYLTRKQEQSFYNKYLSWVDKRIETELLQRALDNGEPPRTTDGLYAPLSQAFKGEHRNNIATVIGANEDASEPMPIRRQLPTGHSETFPRMFGIIFVETWQQRLILWRRFKRPICYCLAIIAILVFWKTSMATIRSAEKPPEPTSNQLEKPLREKRARHIVPELSSPQYRTNAFSSHEIDGPATLEGTEVPSTIRQAALENQRRIERELSEQNRRQLIEQIQATLSTQKKAYSEFKEACEQRLNEGANKADNLSRSHRDAVKKDIGIRKAEILHVFNSEEAILGRFQESLQKLSATTESNPQPVQDALQQQIKKIEAAHQRIGESLDEMDSNIEQSPRKKRYILF